METETGNRNWKQKWEQKTHQSLVQYFLYSVLSHYSSILLSNRYGTDWLMSLTLPLLMYCAPFPYCIGGEEGRENGWEWGRYCTQIGSGYAAIIKLLHTLHAIKTESGSMDKAARVGMLALFQNKVGYSHGQIATSLVPRPSHM